MKIKALLFTVLFVGVFGQLVYAQNTSPVLNPIGLQSVNEGGHLEFAVAATDAETDSLIYTIESLPTNAAFADNGDGTGIFTFDPDYTQAGSYNVSFIVSDTALADTEVVEITVTDVNQAPILASIGAQTVTEGQTLSLAISSSDPDGSLPSLSAENLPANATFIDNTDGTGVFAFTPDYTQAGTATILFIADDGDLADSEYVEVTIVEYGNIAPVLAEINPQSIAEGSSLEFGVTATDVDGNTLTLTAESVPTNATFTDNSDGTGLFTFNPDYTQAGSYNVSFIVSDTALADTEVVEITVTDVNQAPVLASIGAQTVTEGQTLSLAISSSDPDGNLPSLSAENLPANATFIDNTDGTGVFAFTPDYTQAGTATILFIADDGDLADSEYVEVTIVEYGNIAPVLEPIGSQAVNEGAILTLTIAASDLDETTPELSVIDLPTNAGFSDNLDGTAEFSFNPNYYQSGVYYVIFIASDGALADSETVEITVNDFNGPPVLNTIAVQSVTEGDSLTVILSATDPDNDNLTFSTADDLENSYMTNNGDNTGTFNFLPSYMQAGIYTVTIIVSDGVYEDNQDVKIIVTEAGNQAPQIGELNASYSVIEGDSLGIIITASDPDGDVVTFSFGSLPFNSGTLDIAADTVLFYFNPSYLQSGTYNVSVTASDGELSTTVRIHVEVLNYGSIAPYFDTLALQEVDEGDTLTFIVTAHDQDSEEPPVLAVNNQQLNSTFIDNGDGTAQYTYFPDFYDGGVDTVTFIAIDSDNLQGMLHVSIITNETNIAPALAYEGDTIAVQGTTLTAQLIATDSTDGDGGQIYLTTLYLPANASFVDNEDNTGTFTFTPAYNQSERDSAIFVAADQGVPSLSSRITVYFEIRDRNRAPIWSAIDAFEIDQAETLQVTIEATDPDGDTVIIYLADSPIPPRNCSVIDNGDGTAVFTFAPDYTQSGVFVIPVKATDLLATSTSYVFVDVTDLGNQPPTLNYIEDISMTEGDTLQLQITAADPDSTIPIITAENTPYRFEFTDNANGTADVQFIPLFNQAGTYQLLFIAIDPDSVADSQYVNLEVIEAPNQSPYINVIEDFSANEGQSVSLTIYSSDPDSTKPYLSLQDGPGNSVLIDNGNGTGLFAWIPGYTEAGEYEIIFAATDSEDSSLVFTRSVIATIIDVNRAPAIDSIGPYTVNEADTLEFLITAIDPDGPYPRLAQTTILTNSVFTDSANGIGYFRFYPSYSQSGARSIIFTAYDSSDSTIYDRFTVTINVTNVNRTPVLAELPSDTTLNDGVLFMLPVSATDPDATIPILSASNMPSGAVFTDSSNGVGIFSYTPAYGSDGEYNVIFIATDRQYSSSADSQVVTLTVVSTTTHSPQFDSITTSWSVAPDSLISVRMEAFDYDDNISGIAILGSIPDGSAFADSGNGVASFIWIPAEADSGSWVISFIVSDSTELSDTLTLEIDVIAWIRGDANGDGRVIGSDVTYLVNYFRGIVPRPNPLGRGDANGDGLLIGSDVTFLVNYFRGGDAPPASVGYNGQNADLPENQTDGM